MTRMSWSFSSTFPSEAPWATCSHDSRTSFHPTCRPPIGCIVVTPSSTLVIAWTANEGVKLLPRQDNYPFGRSFASLVYHGDLIHDFGPCETIRRGGEPAWPG